MRSRANRGGREPPESLSSRREHLPRIIVDPVVNRAKTVLVFLGCGLAAGVGFGALLSSPRLLTFWFIKGDKFLIPTYRYYLGAGFFLLLSLSAAYSISGIFGLVAGRTLLRRIVSGLIVATSPLVLFATANTLLLATATTKENTPTGTILLTHIDPITLYMWGTVAFVLLISTACWILTAKLYYFGVFLNLLTLPVTFALLHIAARILTVPSDWSELITYPIYFSLLAASCGFWISAGERPS